MAKKDLLVTDDFHSPTIALLDELYTTHKLWEAETVEAKLALLDHIAPHCEALTTPGWIGPSLKNLPFERVDEGLISRLPHLKIIANYGVGYDSVDTKAARTRQIAVTNTPDVLTDDVADFAIGLVLSTSRLLAKGDRYVRAGEWSQGLMRLGRSVTGKQLGIVGLGRIGEAIAQRASALKMEVSYHNRNQKQVPYSYYPDVVSLAQACDFLVLVIPATPETKNIINLEVMKALGAEGTLINVARGSVVDEDALIEALKAGHLGAAGLDVYVNEPNVPQALMDMTENVVLQPHQASATQETRRAMGQLVVDNLVAHFSGKPLLTRVN